MSFLRVRSPPAPKMTRIDGSGRSIALPLCLVPLRVENSRLVHALVRVSPEEIALHLDEVGGEPVTPIGVEVGERDSEGGNRHAHIARRADYLTEVRPPAENLAAQMGVKEDIRQLRLGLV